MTTKKIVTDAHIEIEINERYWWNTKDPEQRAKRLENEANDIKDFIRDHKSMDINDVYVVREYGYKCEYCNDIEKDENKHPECCEAAIREWATLAQLVEFGYEEETPA